MLKQNAAVRVLNDTLNDIKIKLNLFRNELRLKYPNKFIIGIFPSREKKYLDQIDLYKVGIYKTETRAKIKQLIQDRIEIKRALKLLDPIKKGGSRMFFIPVNKDGSVKKGSKWQKLPKR